MAPTLGLAERPLGPARWGYVSTRDLYRAILEGTPYPVRAVLGFGANMLLAHADGRHGREALKALDFYAHADLFMNPTAELADVVLPVASAFEREALKLGFEISQEAQSLIQLRPAVVPPPGEARADTDIIFDLAAPPRPRRRSSGTATSMPPTATSSRRPASRWSSCAPRPAACGVPLQTRHAKHAEPDANGAPRGFATPSRKVELYSQTFLDHGYAPLPDFAEPQIGPVARPDLAARFPAGPDQREAVAVLRDPAPRVAEPAQARPASRKWSCIPQRRRRAASPTATGWRSRRRRAACAPAPGSTTASIRAWWSASTASGRRCAELGAPGYDPFGPTGASFNLLIGTRRARPGQWHPALRSYLCEIRLRPRQRAERPLEETSDRLWHRSVGASVRVWQITSRGPQAIREAPQRLMLPALNCVAGLTGAVKG